MKKRFAGRGLRNRLIRQIILLVLIVVAIGIGSTSLLLTRVISEQLEDSLEAIGHEHLRDLDLYLTFLEETIGLFSKNQLVVNSLIDPQRHEVALPQLAKEFSLSSFVVDLAVLDFTGKQIYGTSEGIIIPPDHPNLRKALASEHRTIQFQETDLYLRVIQPVVYYQTTQGAVVVTLDLGAMLKEILSSHSTRVFRVYNGKTQLLTFNELPGKTYVSTKHISEQEGRHRYVQQLDLALEIGVLQKEYRRPLQNTLLSLLFLSVFFLLLAIVAGWRMGGQLAKPILRLCEKVQQSGNRDEGIPCSPVGTNDELEELALAFDERTSELVAIQSDLQHNNARLEVEIEQRKEAEKSLQAAYGELEEKVHERTRELHAAKVSLDKAQEIAGLGNWDWNIAANTLWWSDEMYRIFGRDPQSFIPTYETFLAMIHPEDREIVEQVITNTRINHKPYSVEHRVVQPDGQDRYVFEQGELQVDSGGGALRIVGTVLDVTVRKQAEVLLKETEERYRTLFEQSPDGIVLVDAESKATIAFNESAHRQLGYEREEFGDLCVSDYEVNESTEETARHMKQILESGQDIFETRHRCKNGELRNVIVNTKVLSIDGSQVFLAIFRDFTLLKRAEEEVKLKAQLLDAANDSIFLHDRDGHILEANEAAWKSRGFESKEELLRSNIKKLDAPEFAKVFPLRVQEMMEHGYCMFEAAHVCKDGSLLPLDIAAKFIEVDGEKMVLSVARDIRARKEIEAKLQQFTRELERSNKELQQFAYVASHDLQEPLRKIQAFGDQLKRHGANSLDERSLNYLERMQNAAGRMRHLIEGLLQFSRVTTKGKPLQVVTLQKVVAEVLVDLEELLLQTGGKVEVGELPQVCADRLQMQQLFQNLIVNGLKYQLPGQVPRVTVSSKATADSGWEIMVSDNGIGFDEKYLERIFVPFQRLHTRDEYEGTGMGLAICEKIVKRHGGTITAHSSEGQGATFIVSLPSDTEEGGVEHV